MYSFSFSVTDCHIFCCSEFFISFESSTSQLSNFYDGGSWLNLLVLDRYCNSSPRLDVLCFDSRKISVNMWCRKSQKLFGYKITIVSEYTICITYYIFLLIFLTFLLISTKIQIIVIFLASKWLFLMLFFSCPLYVNKYKNNYKIQYNSVCVHVYCCHSVWLCFSVLLWYSVSLY